MSRKAQPIAYLKSYRWVREQKRVEPCCQCGARSPFVLRLFHSCGSTYYIECERCGFHPKAAFSLDPAHGLKRALVRWNNTRRKA